VSRIFSDKLELLDEIMDLLDISIPAQSNVIGLRENVRDTKKLTSDVPFHEYYISTNTRS
jgi:hypothetical protein